MSVSSVIWKFRESLEAGYREEQAVVVTLHLPITATITSAAVSDVALSVWAIVPEREVPVEPRQFVIAGTGFEYDPKGLRFICASHIESTFHEHGYVFHIFEKTT